MVLSQWYNSSWFHNNLALPQYFGWFNKGPLKRPPFDGGVTVRGGGSPAAAHPTTGGTVTTLPVTRRAPIDGGAPAPVLHPILISSVVQPPTAPVTPPTAKPPSIVDKILGMNASSGSSSSAVPTYNILSPQSGTATTSSGPSPVLYLVLALVIGGVWFYLSHRKKPNTAKAEKSATEEMSSGDPLPNEAAA